MKHFSDCHTKECYFLKSRIFTGSHFYKKLYAPKKIWTPLRVYHKFLTAEKVFSESGHRSIFGYLSDKQLD